MNQKRLIDYLEEKANDPLLKDKTCIETINKDGTKDSITYYDLYDNITNVLDKIKEKHPIIEKCYDSWPMDVYKTNGIPLIMLFLGTLALKYKPLLNPIIFTRKYVPIYVNDDSGDFYVFSSGSTGELTKPKPVKEEHVIKSVVDNFINKYHLENEKFYSTISMSGIAGVTMGIFFPIITNNSVCFNDNTDFFENVYRTKSTMFILPLNYKDFLPIKDPSCNDYSHVKYIMISGGYFNNNDINTLLENLPGLKKESIIYMYSSTELEGNSIANDGLSTESIYLSMPELLKGNVVFKNDIDSIEYLSTGLVDSNLCQIVDNEGNNLEEDKLGFIKINNRISDDLGIIHNKKLFVIGRKQDNDKYNLSILNNYFRYHLNNDVACGIYRGELIVYTDIIDNYFGYVSRITSKKPYCRKKIYQSAMENFNLRDNANKLIKYLENEHDIEFYGDSILVKFGRNERLEKIIFDYKKYNPFDKSMDNINGSNKFDEYYFINYNFESLFVGYLMDTLNIFGDKNDLYSIKRNIDDSYDMFKKLYDNPELFNNLKDDKTIKLFFTALHLRYITTLLVNFDTIAIFNKKRMNIDSDTLRDLYDDCLYKYPPEYKNKIRELYCMLLELLYNIDIRIDKYDLTGNDIIELMQNKNINYFTYIEEKINKGIVKKKRR